jgi:sec-independent protein translocase protein TatA
MKTGFWEILLIVILILILFGHSKIPDMMKNLASGINVFKKELKKDDEPAKAKSVAKAVNPVAKKAKIKKKPTPKKK